MSVRRAATASKSLSATSYRITQRYPTSKSLRTPRAAFSNAAPFALSGWFLTKLPSGRQKHHRLEHPNPRRVADARTIRLSSDISVAWPALKLRRPREEQSDPFELCIYDQLVTRGGHGLNFKAKRVCV